jgi:protein-arginine kinase activator protein McsA
MQCEGYRRYGGAFTLGIVKWEQCKEEATVLITFIEKDETKTLPGCQTCWKECIENKYSIVKVEPIMEVSK